MNEGQLSFLYLLVAIITEVIATSALKSTHGFTQLFPSIITVMGYFLSFYFLSLTLKTIPVSLTYAIWSGLGIVLITAVDYLYYKQSLDFPAILGLSLILVGTLIINIFSKAIPH